MRALLLGLVLAGCASTVPKPTVLANVDDARSSPAARESERRAPQAFARAEQLRERAHDANESGYPSCATKPGADHPTVVVISEKHDRR